MTQTIIQSATFIVYVAFIIYRFGVLPSISESWYMLPRKFNFLFTLFTWGIGIPMLFYGNPFLFISGAALTFVGVATQFKTTQAFTKQVHYIGALIGVSVPLFYFGFSLNNWIPLNMQIVGIMIIALTTTPNKIWWVEIVAFVCVLFGLINL